MMESSAVRNLYPNAAFVIKGEELTALDDTIFNMELIVQEEAKLKYQEEINSYKAERARKYPPYTDYLDGLVKGDQDQINAYITACQAVKDSYPKTEIDETELTARKAQALFDYQLAEYTKAVARLAQYVLADGRAEVTEMQNGLNQLTDSDGALQFDSDGAAIYEQVEVITVTAIDPLPATVTETQYDSDGAATEVEVTNPLITKDSEERAAAQAIVDATPQPVIDEYNS